MKERRTGEVAVLLCIIVLAASLRLYNLGQSPPGMNVDEAAVAWNAYCLLKTGMDQHGVQWPIFDSEGFGQGMSTLSLYITIPFQAIGGLNVITTRLPAALAGILTVYLLYIVGKRLFNRQTGLVAAALLAVNPWHLQQSRWGHMGALFPLLAIAPLAAMLWANLPIADDDSRRPNTIKAALAGLITGICCYGYYAARLWVPVFYSVVIIVNWKAWWKLLKTREGARAAVALVLSFLIIFGPLVIATISVPLLQKRAHVSWAWNPSDSLITKVEKIFARYPGHYGLDFLFRRGDIDIAISPPMNYGLFHWYMLPMMILGIIPIVRRIKESRSAKLLFLWIALYPVADLFSEHPSMHAMRSLPGVCSLTLLAALGLVVFSRILLRRHRSVTALAASLAIGIFLFANVRFLHAFYGEFNKEPQKYFVGHSDLLEACKWIKPRINDKDVFFITGSGMAHPEVYTLVGLRYDPRQWFLDKKETTYDAPRKETIWLRYGKMIFLYHRLGETIVERELSNLSRMSRDIRAVFILRPGEFFLGDKIVPSYQIKNTQGYTALSIYEVTLKQKSNN